LEFFASILVEFPFVELQLINTWPRINQQRIKWNGTGLTLP
jgi:hypothetical protein